MQNQIAPRTNIAGETMGDINSLTLFIPTADLLLILDLPYLIPISVFDALFSLCDPSSNISQNWPMGLFSLQRRFSNKQLFARILIILYALTLN